MEHDAFLSYKLINRATTMIPAIIIISYYIVLFFFYSSLIVAVIAMLRIRFAGA